MQKETLVQDYTPQWWWKQKFENNNNRKLNQAKPNQTKKSTKHIFYFRNKMFTCSSDDYHPATDSQQLT